MSRADAFKNLVRNRKQTQPDQGEPENPTPSNTIQTQPDISTPPIEEAGQTPTQSVSTPTPVITTPPLSNSTQNLTQPAEPKRRGRPATGKRSDDAWIGRTYYVKRETDLDVEDELLKLRRRGIEIDKSELVDFLLAAWVKWQQGENIEFRLDEFSPRRNSEKP